jgi:methylmalonyl-CoA mutase N-terminal domain/subunit
VAAIERGFQKEEIERSAYDQLRAVEQGERVVVGVNRYAIADEQQIPTLKVDPRLEQQQILRVQALRARRDSAAVESALARLKEAAARDGSNLMPPIIEAARARVTMGEMCDAFREIWGIWRETPVF